MLFYSVEELSSFELNGPLLLSIQIACTVSCACRMPTIKWSNPVPHWLVLGCEYIKKKYLDIQSLLLVCKTSMTTKGKVRLRM